MPVLFRIDGEGVLHHPDVVELRTVMNRVLDMEGLKEVCLVMGIDHENLSYSSKGSLIMSLIDYMTRRSMWRDFANKVNVHSADDWNYFQFPKIELSDLVLDEEKAPVKQPPSYRQSLYPSTGPDQYGRFDGDLKVLSEKMSQWLSKSNLSSICFDMGIDSDDYSHMGKTKFIIELVKDCDASSRIDELISSVEKCNPSRNFRN